MFVAFLFVSIAINILVHLKDFLSFLPESAVFGPQIPAYEYPTSSQREFNYGHKEDKYSEKGEQERRYSYQNRWEELQSKKSTYTEGRVKKDDMVRVNNP